MTTNYEKIKQLDITDFAYTLCVDNVGDCRGVCAICQRHTQNNCDDRCVSGVIEWLLEDKDE